MAPPLPHPVCPVLLDIGSSRAVSVPYVHHHILPAVRNEWHSLSPARLIRPCGFAPERPPLQHASWAASWQAYIQAVRERGKVAAAGLAPIAASNTFPPLMGTMAPLLIPVPLPETPPHPQEKEEEMMMEFFRVDAFIPVRVQMFYALRRLLRLRNLWETLAVAIVAPEHDMTYFVDAVKQLTEEATSCTFLVYDQKGIRFRHSGQKC